MNKPKTGKPRFRLCIDFKTLDAMLAFVEFNQFPHETIPAKAGVRLLDGLDTAGKRVKTYIVSTEPGVSGFVKRDEA